jgi:hypothetical protein
MFAFKYNLLGSLDSIFHTRIIDCMPKSMQALPSWKGCELAPRVLFVLLRALRGAQRRSMLLVDSFDPPSALSNQLIAMAESCPPEYYSERLEYFVLEAEHRSAQQQARGRLQLGLAEADNLKASVAILALTVINGLIVVSSRLLLVLLLAVDLPPLAGQCSVSPTADRIKPCIFE